MGVKIRTRFDNPSATFRPGEVIKGTVFLNIAEVKKLTLTFHGEGKILWKETKFGQFAQDIYDEQQGRGVQSSINKIHPASSSPRHIRVKSANHGATQTEVDFDPNTGEVQRLVLEYRNQETYLHAPLNLPVKKDESLTEQNVPFTFQLPSNLPSSCELCHGSIKYFPEAQATYKDTFLEIPHDSTESSYESFYIRGSLDLGLINGALSPAVVENEEQFYGFLCCCKKGGEFGMKLSLGRSGFVHGEKISFELNYKNDSTLTLKKVTASLNQTITFIASGGAKMSEEKQMCEVPHSLKIFPGSKGACVGQVPVSKSALITDLGGCRIMQIRYVFKITAKGSCGREAIVQVPITIGGKAPAAMEEVHLNNTKLE